jgi:tRNA(Ile)-lysidine synthase
MIFAMADLLRSVARYVRRYDLLPGGAVVVGVSGGPDSLCLLHLMRRLAPELGVVLHVAHLNHGLRGTAAVEDAAAVAALAAASALPATVERVDVPFLATQSGLSIEEAARHARYEFLAATAQRVGARTVAVAHHADDQAETVLMHFLRGSGAAGLRGMLPKTELATELTEAEQADAGRIVLVRPLLEVTRAEIMAYCQEHGIEPRYDLTNADTTIYRNRLRHELLPLLEGYNPRIRTVLAHTATVLAGEYEVLSAVAMVAWDRVVVPAGPGEVAFDRAAWRTLPLAMQRATVRGAIRRLRASLRNVNWEHVERAVWLAREGTTGHVATLTAGLELAIGYDTLRVQPEGRAELPPVSEAPMIDGAVGLAAPGGTQLPGGWQVTVRRLARSDLPADFAANADPWTAWLDADATGPELTLRPRAPGDRFAPQGLGGHSTKLNEFMINAKVPAAARRGWPLLIGASSIAWVCGLRLAEPACVSTATTSIWEVVFRRDPWLSGII